MKGCLAPSEIPGLEDTEWRRFGTIAEEIIYMDLRAQYGEVSSITPQFFKDDHNPSGYLNFLVSNNPGFTQERQIDFYTRVKSEELFAIPDFMIHRPNEKAFYEVKPNSATGRRDGAEKVGKLRAIYRFYQLPYKAGIIFNPKDHRVGFLGGRVTVTLRVERIADGLIVYKLCLESNEEIELAVVSILLAHIVRELNKQRRRNTITVIDLEPIFAGNRQLNQVAGNLGLKLATGAAVAVVAVTWRHFWKAVAIRFAVRGAIALGLAAADGPLPIGDLVALGMTIWTVVDIIRLSDILWREAAVIAQKGA